MKRRLFNLAAAVSLVLCVATLATWIIARCRPWATGNDTLRSAYFDKTYGLATDGWVIAVRWMEIVDQPGERKIFSTDYMGPGTRTFVFVRAPDGSGPRGQPWARHGVLAFPYWAAVIATAILPTWWVGRFVARRRRSRFTLTCQHCGYDLRATPDRCPECGAVPARAPGAAI